MSHHRLGPLAHDLMHQVREQYARQAVTGGFTALNQEDDPGKAARWFTLAAYIEGILATATAPLDAVWAAKWRTVAHRHRLWATQVHATHHLAVVG